MGHVGYCPASLRPQYDPYYELLMGGGRTQEAPSLGCPTLEVQQKSGATEPTTSRGLGCSFGFLDLVCAGGAGGF